MTETEPTLIRVYEVVMACGAILAGVHVYLFRHAPASWLETIHAVMIVVSLAVAVAAIEGRRRLRQ